MLTEKVELLNKQVSSLTEINNLYSVQDSLRVQEVNIYREAYKSSLDDYSKLNRKYKITKVGSVLLLLLGILICR